MLQEAPKNFYQYERDFKSFKGEKGKKIKYLENIKGENVKVIFKSDLQADPMLEIFTTFLDQDTEWFKQKSQFVVDFI